METRKQAEATKVNCKFCNEVHRFDKIKDHVFKKHLKKYNPNLKRADYCLSKTQIHPELALLKKNKKSKAESSNHSESDENSEAVSQSLSEKERERE